MRLHNLAGVLPLLVALAACAPDQPEWLTVSEVSAFAPLPGQPAGVAYFSLHNAGNAAVTLHEVTSPEFASVRMHTTLVDDGVARMMALDLLTVAEHSEVVFAPGGPHLMLMEPVEGLSAGDVVTFEFHYVYEQVRDGEDENLLAVRTALQSR